MGETTNRNCGAGFCSINSTSTTAVVMNLWQEKAEAYVKDTWNLGILLLRNSLHLKHAKKQGTYV